MFRVLGMYNFVSLVEKLKSKQKTMIAWYKNMM